MFSGWRCRHPVVEPEHMLPLIVSGLSATSRPIEPLQHREWHFSPVHSRSRLLKTQGCKQTITDLALISHLCHQVCDVCKDIIKLCVCSLKKRQRDKMKESDPNWTDDEVNIQRTCRHLDRDLRLFICSSGGLGWPRARPVYTAPGGPLQHLQTQTGRAPQRRLQPGLACHEQVEWKSGAFHLSGGTRRALSCFTQFILVVPVLKIHACAKHYFRQPFIQNNFLQTNQRTP